MVRNTISPGENSFIAIRVHAETSLHHVCKFADYYVILSGAKNLFHIVRDPPRHPIRAASPPGGVGRGRFDYGTEEHRPSAQRDIARHHMLAK
jgi:hypothetical protein